MGKSRFYSNYGNIQYTSEEDTKSALIQLSIFFVYLICLTIVCSSLASEYFHHFTNGIRTLFERPHHMMDNRTISFREVITIEDFWNFMEYVVINLFHGVEYDETSNWDSNLANNRPLLHGKMILNESLLLGPPRLRQIRVRNDTCPLNAAFFRYYNTCVAPYSEEVEFKEPVYKGSTFKTMSELGVTSTIGRVNTYHSGGYVQSLTYEKDINRGIIRHLNYSKWLDRNSRLVLCEFSVVNLNSNVLQSVKLIFEIMPTGLINSLYKSDIIYANSPFISSGWTMMLCAAIVYLINFYYTYVEVRKLYLNGWKIYFSELSIVLDLPRIFILHISLGFSIYYIAMPDIFEVINNAKGKFIPLDHDVLAYNIHQDLMGFLVFLSWMVVLKFMNFNPVLRTIGRAMQMAATDLGAFAVMFFIAIASYGNLGVMLFGGSNENFLDFPTAFLTTVRMMVRDFNYFELEDDFHVLGPIFFLTYVVFIFFVLLNMFLAVIVLAFRTATKMEAYEPNFFWYYIRKQLYRVTNGLFKAPKYPKFRDGIALNQQLDAKKLRELRLIKYYTETEEDLDTLLSRLDLIENIFHRLTHNMDDLIEKAKHNNKTDKQQK